MTRQRWLRIIPVALIMYTIAFIDRANLSMAMPYMMKAGAAAEGGQGFLTDEQKGLAAGIFFFGYLLLQIPGGHLAQVWSAKRFIAILLVLWGLAATSIGLVRNAGEFMVARFVLGVTEGGVFPATLVLLAHWFPKAERARANAFWSLCQPLAIAATGPLSGLIIKWWGDRLGVPGWRAMLVAEGALPFLWLGVWLTMIEDHPRSARWLRPPEREEIEAALGAEAAAGASEAKVPFVQVLLDPQVLLLILIYFVHNCGAYGLLYWAPDFLKERLPASLASAGEGSAVPVGLLFAIPYLVTAVVMLLVARHSDRTRERRGHVAFALGTSGIFLLLCAFSARFLSGDLAFWVSFGCLCLAAPGPFANLGPFWAVPAETLPRPALGRVMGIINALGNMGGFFGPMAVGYLKGAKGDMFWPFLILSAALISAAGMALLLRRTQASVPVPAEVR